MEFKIYFTWLTIGEADTKIIIKDSFSVSLLEMIVSLNGFTCSSKRTTLLRLPMIFSLQSYPTYFHIPSFFINPLFNSTYFPFAFCSLPALPLFSYHLDSYIYPTYSFCTSTTQGQSLHLQIITPAFHGRAVKMPWCVSSTGCGFQSWS